MSDVSAVTGPITDTGTGLYPNPPAEVTHGNPDEDAGPTGSFPNPPTEVTYTSDEHEQPPTGAHLAPPTEVTRHTDWPAPDTPVLTESSVVEPEAKPAKKSTARKSAAKKRGS